TPCAPWPTGRIPGAPPFRSPLLAEPFYFDRQREHAPGDAVVIQHPLFEAEDGRLAGRLSRYQVRNGHALAGVPLDAPGQAALDALEEVMGRPGMAGGFPVAAGPMRILNNPPK